MIQRLFTRFSLMSCFFLCASSKMYVPTLSFHTDSPFVATPATPPLYESKTVFPQAEEPKLHVMISTSYIREEYHKMMEENARNKNTRWWVFEQTKDAVTLDLRSSTPINQMMLKWNVRKPVEYAIQLSPDNIHWKTVHTQKSSEEQFDIANIDTNTRFIRIVGMKMEVSLCLRFWDMFKSDDPLPPMQDDTQKTQATFFPNPSKGIATLSFPAGEAGSAAIKVYSLSKGITQVVDEQTIQVTKGLNKFPLRELPGHLPNGLYYYSIETGTRQLRGKFMLER